MSKKFAGRGSRSNFARKIEEVEIAGDDGSIEVFRLQALSGAEADAFGATVFKERVVDGGDGKVETKREVETVALKAKLVARCWVGESGTREYADDEIAMLNAEWPASVIDKLFKVCERMNGLDANAAKEAEKNSVGGQPASSTSV